MSSWFVRTYDLLYGTKDYGAEAARVAGIVRERRPDAKTLLDVACGSGRHLEHLRASFTCEGAEIDKDALALARHRLPGIPLHHADMVDMRLGKTFDAIVCLFSAIGYVQTRDRMFQAVASMAAHLNPRGVLVVEPWVLAENWRPGGTTYVHQAEQGQDKIIRVSATHREGDLSVLDFHYAWASPGKISTGDERHLLGLFSRQDYLGAFEAAGIDGYWEGEGLIGRGLVIGQWAEQ